MTVKCMHPAERGMVLVSSLLLLLIVTILAVGMFRSFGIQEKIAGNIREKQRALHAAEDAQQYAEWWLSTGANASSVPAVCNALYDANLGTTQICSNKLFNAVASIASVPWQANVGGVLQEIGVKYLPPGMNEQAVAQIGSYWQRPRFYISDLGPGADGLGEVFQIDAVGYGGNPLVPTVSVVESTYEVTPGVINRGGP